MYFAVAYAQKIFNMHGEEKVASSKKTADGLNVEATTNVATCTNVAYIGLNGITLNPNN